MAMTRMVASPKLTPLTTVGGHRQQRAQAEHLDQAGVLFPQAVGGDLAEFGAGHHGFGSVALPF